MENPLDIVVGVFAVCSSQDGSIPPFMNAVKNDRIRNNTENKILYHTQFIPSFKSIFPIKRLPERANLNVDDKSFEERYSFSRSI